MAEQLKAIYHEAFLRQFGEKIQSVFQAFHTEGFIDAVMDETWEGLELRARMGRITEVLRGYLPMSYEESLGVLFAIDDTCTGFPYLFLPDFVAAYGLAEEHWELSMKALERFTVRSSSEFAIRPFLLQDPERAMCQMAIWARHPSEDVRRLASEGCRPRLPWAVALPKFKKDPRPVLAILEQLKTDPSLYVRKSVANNLNDISKDNPDLVLQTARRWKGENPYTDWIIRHGCRTLIRQANADVLELFGYAKTDDVTPLITSASLMVQPSLVKMGESCELKYDISLRQGEPVHLRIEYGIHFVKAKGHTSRKLFLLSDKTVPGGTRLTGTRTHSWSDLTTRRHYPGEHKIVLLVNGVEVADSFLTLNSLER